MEHVRWSTPTSSAIAPAPVFRAPLATRTSTSAKLMTFATDMVTVPIKSAHTRVTVTVRQTQFVFQHIFCRNANNVTNMF